VRSAIADCTDAWSVVTKLSLALPLFKKNKTNAIKMATTASAKPTHPIT
jgi:hypothetical protein